MQEPEDEDSMQGTSAQQQINTQYSQGTSQDWLSQSIRQSVSDWKTLFKNGPAVNDQKFVDSKIGKI